MGEKLITWPSKSEDRIFLRRWAISCVVGFLLVFVVASRITYTSYIEDMDPDIVYGGYNAVASLLVFAFLLMLGIGPIVALCQLYAIYYVRRTLSVKRWALGALLSVAISGCLAAVARLLLSSPGGLSFVSCLFSPMALLVAMAFGPGLGPWLTLVRAKRKVVGETGSSWIQRSMFAWPAVILLSFLSGTLSPAAHKYPFNDLVSMLCCCVGWTLGAVLYGIYTGLALLPLIGNAGAKVDREAQSSLPTATT